MTQSIREGRNPFADRRSENVELSERQIDLTKRWNARRLTRDALEERGVRVDPVEYQAYRNKKRDYPNMFKLSEEGAMAELMLCEGADDEGMTRSKRPYQWFGDLAFAYPANEIDDAMRGTDAIVLFSDPEDERKAYPVAVDVKTNKEDFDDRVLSSLGFLRTGAKRVYWADTTLESGASSFDIPEPGKIPSLELYACIPHEVVKEFRDDKTTHVRAEQMMRNLGPFMRQQFQTQLEVMALLLTDALRLDDLRSDAISLREPLDREQLIRKLRRAGERMPQLKLKCEVIENVLQRIWDEQDSQGDMDLAGMTDRQPQIIKRLAGLLETGHAE